MHPISIVFRKELKDGRRDKRSLMSAFFFPILAPVLVYGMMTAIISIRTSAEQKVIPIVGMQNAPTFIKWLKEQDVKVETFTGDPRQAVIDKKEDHIGLSDVGGQPGTSKEPKGTKNQKCPYLFHHAHDLDKTR